MYFICKNWVIKTKKKRKGEPSKLNNFIRISNNKYKETKQN